MTNQNDTPGLRPADFTQQRGEAITEGVKAFLWMKGGAAVAMLAFLQAIWATNTYLVKFVIGGIGLFSIGVLLAGFVHLFRYSASFNFQGGNPRKWKMYQGLYLGCSYGSVVAFISGVAVVPFGAWSGLK